MLEDEQEKALFVDDTQFRQWLIRCREEIVGRVGSKEGCPLANWLNECMNRGEYRVGRGDYGVEGRNSRLPGWAWRFVTLLDLQDTGFIYGKDALEILEGVFVK